MSSPARIVYAFTPEQAVALAQAGWGVPASLGQPARPVAVERMLVEGARRLGDEIDHMGQSDSLFCPSGCWNGWWTLGLAALGFAVGGFAGWQVANAMQLGTAAGKALPALLPVL
jgi:hypothetical protein